MIVKTVTNTINKLGIVISLLNALFINPRPKIIIIIAIIRLVMYSTLPWPKGCSLSAGFKDRKLPKIAIKSVAKSLNE